MANYISLLNFTEQGSRNVKHTVTRSGAAIADAQKMGVKITDLFWTMGAYDLVLILEAPDDETVSAFAAKVSSLGNVQTQTLRAFREEAMRSILAKIK